MMGLFSRDGRLGRRRQFRPAVSGLEDRALTTQLGAAVSMPQPSVQIRNNTSHGKLANLPIRTLAGHWNVNTWFTAYGARVTGVTQTEFQDQDITRIENGSIVSTEAAGSIVADWTISPQPRRGLLLTVNSNNGTISLPGRQVGPNSYAFEGPVQLPGTGPNTRLRSVFTIVNRDTYTFGQFLNTTGQWQLLYAATNTRIHGVAAK